MSRQTFRKCQDFLDCQDKLFDDVEIERHDRDPQAYVFDYPNLSRKSSVKRNEIVLQCCIVLVGLSQNFNLFTFQS